jgi:hypothetical protein
MAGLLAAAGLRLLAGEPVPGDSPAADPAHLLDERLEIEPPDARAPHVAGAPTTLFVNFDGVTLTACTPSSAADDCSALGGNRVVPPFSGGTQARAAILQALRELIGDRGIRVTGTRPDERGYTMVVYGGDAGREGVLGLGPSGDCGDAIPGQIAFAYLDGALSDWVNGGATTVLHEAAHTWGLDHVGAPGTLMFPTGDDRPVQLGDACAPVVADAGLTPGGPTCPDAHAVHCGLGERQAAGLELRALFGPRVPDTTPPTLALTYPADGAQFAAPASFHVEIDVADDAHPQAYDVQAWIAGETPISRHVGAFDRVVFEVGQLGPGDHVVHVIVADLGGNQTGLDFVVRVDDTRSGGAADGCRLGAPPGLLPLLWLVRRRRIGPRPSLARAPLAPRRRPRYMSDVMPAPRILAPPVLVLLASACPQATGPAPDDAAGKVAAVPTGDKRVVEVDGDYYPAKRPPEPPAASPGTGRPDETNGKCRLFAPELRDPACCERQLGFDVETVQQACGFRLYLGESFHGTCGYHFLTDATATGEPPRWFRLAVTAEADAKAAAEAHDLRTRKRVGIDVRSEPIPGVPGAYWSSHDDLHWAFLPGWSQPRMFTWSDRSCSEDGVRQVLTQLIAAPEVPAGAPRAHKIPSTRPPAAAAG